MPPRKIHVKSSAQQPLPTPKALPPAMMGTLDLAISNRIENPNQFSAKHYEQLGDFFKSYTNFIPVIYVITKRRANLVLSDGALHLISELDEALYQIVRDNALEFYTHVLVLYGRYFEFLIDPVCEQDVLDSLLCALMISAKVSVGLHVNDMRKILQYIYENENDELFHFMSNHIEEKKSHFSLNKRDILLQHEQELLEIFDAMKNKSATKAQSEFFDEALLCLPNSLDREFERHHHARNLLQHNGYLKQETLLALESAFLSRMNWRVSLLCNHAQLRQFMMMCWHYGANLLDPAAKNNASTEIHHHILQAFEALLNDFGKVTTLPLLTGSPSNHPRQNDDDDNDNETHNSVTGLTFAFDALSLRPQRHLNHPNVSSSSQSKKWSP